MANLFIGFNRNSDYSPDQATSGSSTGSTDVEVRVDLSKAITAEDLKLILEAIIRWSEDARVNNTLITGGLV